MNKPYLSIIIASRNDDYAGGILKKMQMTLPFLIQQLNSYEISTEIILIDWNYPSDKPKIKDVLTWPNANSFCSIRVIEVSSIYHQRYEYWQDRPMHAAAAVNVGLRRARGMFCLNKVNDSFWSDELVKFISEKQLATDALYRCDRVDVAPGILSLGCFGDVSQIINYCQNHIIKTHNYIKKDVFLSRRPNLHTDACGDFQMMARQNWHLLRGYLDRTVYAYKVDGLLSYCAYGAGIREVRLDDAMRVYKILHNNLHGNRVKYQPSLIQKIAKRLTLRSFIKNKNVIDKFSRTIASLGLDGRVVIGSLLLSEYHDYIKPAEDIVTGKRSYVLNGHNWGLGDVELHEFCLHKAAWE